MDLHAISRTLGALALMVAAPAAPLGFLAQMQGDPHIASAFAITVAIGVFLGVSLMIITRGRPPRGGVREAVLFAVLAWTAVPALAAPPLIAASGDALRGYADALSAVTTTGLRPFFLESGRSGALSAWWNLLQWSGGVGTVLTGLIVLASINVSGEGLHRSPLFTLEQNRIFERFVPVGLAILSVYALGTAVAFLLLWVGGAGPLRAAAIAAAGVSTGGLLLPGGATSLAGTSPITAAAASLALIFGAFNFALHYDALRGRGPRVYARDLEARGLAIFFVIAIALVIWVTTPETSADIIRSATAGIALASTAGWSLGQFEQLPHLAPLILALIIIGGSPASTAGGVKLIRIVLLARQAGRELNRLSLPSSVYELRFRGKSLPSAAVMSMLAYVVAYAVGLGGLIIAFGGAGADFVVATAAAASALTNTGPALALAAGDAGLAALQSPAALTIYCIGMVLGRLEVFAVFAMLSPSFWRV